LCESQGVTIILTDVQNYVDRDVKLPFSLVEQDHDLPFDDESFDSVLLLTVLHHASNPIKVLSESVRVSRHQLVIIESVYDVKARDIRGYGSSIANFHDQKALPLFLSLNKEQQRLYATVLDWFYNRVLENEVTVPNDFNTIKNWEAIFDELGLQIDKKHILGFDQPTAPEFHVKYVLSKR
jgi:ubiquinone/menaquinone biosynthesis C-methylase UbiE